MVEGRRSSLDPIRHLGLEAGRWRCSHLDQRVTTAWAQAAARAWRHGHHDPLTAPLHGGRHTTQPAFTPFASCSAVARPGGRPAMGPPRAPRPPPRHGRRLLLEPHGERLGQCLLLRRRAGGLTELECLLLRRVGRGRVDHRRQAAGVPVGHGPVRAPVRAQLLRDPRAPGAHGCGERRLRPRERQALLGRRRRPARRRGPRAHPGRGPDVSLQQPRRAPRAAHDGRRLGDDARDRARLDPLVRPRGCAHRPRFPHQDPPGPARRALPRHRLPRRRGHHAASTDHRLPRRHRHDARRRRLVGGHRRARPGEHAALHRRQPDRLLPRADLRLQRSRPDQRQRDRVRRRRQRLG